NMGLTHNMAASSDALNYGENFWKSESLPKELDLALSQTKDIQQKEILTKCVENKKLAKKSVGSIGADYVITTQDCLRQSEVMYSSIMDYHASWNSDVGGLGSYDKAAIKFGYAQLAEVFPKKNIKVNTGKAKLSDWLFLNDWRKIPSELFSKTDKIFDRQHVKYNWDKTTTTFAVPENEVPYRFCLDSSGSYGVNCKAFDFGPDMRTRAERNNTLYWQHYFLTHFSRGRLWDYNTNAQSVIRKDLSIMADYNHIMQWYYFNRATVKNFVGSDAEKDYLAATVMGLNHFVRVLGHPLPGEHASVPAYLTDSVENRIATADRTQATSILLPYGKIDSCVRLNVVDSFLGVPIGAKPGHFFTNVPLGDGRPFFMGLNHDYEKQHVNYVGSLISKLSAAYFLAKPGASFPRTDQLTDPRFYNVSWYRLFPEEVSEIFYNLITDNVANMGPVVDSEGKIAQRMLLDPETLTKPDYTGYGNLLPTMSSLMPYRAMFYASALLSGNLGSEMDMIKMMRVSLMGSEDDLGIYDKLDKNDIATFVHPIQGYNYRALKVGNTPIAYEMVKNLNTLKEKYVRLESCINSEAVRVSDSFCDCIKTKMVKDNGQSMCCYPGNPDCPGIGLMKVGKGNCSMHDLNVRKIEIAEKMENMVSFLDDMRWFVKKFSAMP
ncbi:MAG: hypothetical protein O2897_05020, partial [bacterium]|nr:hypothetical protein [bacterium]